MILATHSLSLECVRQIRDGKLYLAARNIGSNGGNTGIQWSQPDLFFVNAVGIELRRACCRWRVTSLALSIARWDLISTMATVPEAPL